MTSRWRPNTTVATVVEKDNHYLMVTEKDKTNPSDLCINQPAGHLEPHESLFQAAIRETQEETGWQVELTGIVGIYCYQPEFQQQSDSNSPLTYLRVCFAANPIAEKASQALDEGIVQASWMTKHQISTSETPLRSPMVLQAIKDYEKKSPIPLNLIQHMVENSGR